MLLFAKAVGPTWPETRRFAMGCAYLHTHSELRHIPRAIMIEPPGGPRNYSGAAVALQPSSRRATLYIFSLQRFY